MAFETPFGRGEPRGAGPVDSVPKVCGGDIELGNFLEGRAGAGSYGYEASRALLKEMPGIDASPVGYYGGGWSGSTYPGDGGASGSGRGDRASSSSSSDLAGGDYATASGQRTCGGGYGSWGYGGGGGFGYDPQDWGRKFIPANGGCAYIDLNHLEICTPEVLSAHDFVASFHGMLRIVRDARDQANAKLDPGEVIQVLVNNRDSQGASFGSHLNFLVTAPCFENIFHHKLHYMLYLASYLASGIIFTGAGKVGSDNDRPEVDYQISQRADFFQILMGSQTTHNRPLINSRDEALCGSALFSGRDSPAERFRRLHIIVCDNGLAHVATLLKVGATQIFLAMMEQECPPRMIIDHPLVALWSWSRNPQTPMRLASGRRYTAAEVQLAILEEARAFVDAGRADGLVPRAKEILELWADTVEKLSGNDLGPLVSRLDWVLKRAILERAIARHRLRWDSPEVRHLDHLYSSLDAEDGLYWAYERSGAVERVVSAGDIERFVHEPPGDTRAYLRAHVLRRVNPEALQHVDWDRIQWRVSSRSRGAWGSYSYYTLRMESPLRFNRRDCGHLVDRRRSLLEILEGLESQEPGSDPPAGGSEGVSEASSVGGAAGPSAHGVAEGMDEHGGKDADLSRSGCTKDEDLEGKEHEHGASGETPSRGLPDGE